MTKKHFIALADAIKKHDGICDGKFNDQQMVTLANFCASQNPRFNRQRWIEYIAGKCGKNGGKVKASA